MTAAELELTSLPHPYVQSLDVIRKAAPDRAFVVAQLGQSLDGRIALPSGESRWINKDCALDHLHRLRGLVDAVVVGVGTAIADDPALNVRRVSARNPARVVIDPSGRLPAGLKLLAHDGAERIVVTTAGRPVPDGAKRIVLAPSAGSFPPRAIVAALHAHGLKRLLIEGGAYTVSSFIDADVVDRLHVLVAPCLLGSGKAGLNLAPLARLADARRPRTSVHVLDDGDVLFDCDLRT